MINLLVQVGGFVALLFLGYVFGRLAERRHFKRLIVDEHKLSSLPAIASRYPPDDQNYRQELVSGSVVVASDYFKAFLAGLINLFGGRVTPFESLLDRARRESLIRMKKKAASLNATLIFNVKYETTRIAAGRMGALEVLTYGTAMIPENNAGSGREV